MPTLKPTDNKKSAEIIQCHKNMLYLQKLIFDVIIKYSKTSDPLLKIEYAERFSTLQAELENLRRESCDITYYS